MTNRKVGSLWANLGLRTAGLSKGIKTAKGEIRKFGFDLKRAGRTLQKSLTLPLTALAGVSAKFAIDFNRDISSIGTLLGGVSNESQARLREMKAEIQDLSISSGKSTSELAQGMYSVVSAFGDTADAGKQLQIATKLGVAGLGTTEEAIKAISSATKAYGDTSGDAQEKVANLIQQTIADGETNLRKLSPALALVTADTADLGVKQEELFAIMSTGTGALGEASQVATRLKATMSNLNKPNQDLIAIYQRLGVANAQQLIQQKGLVGTLQALKVEAQTSGVQFKDLFGSVEAVGFANAFTSGLADDFTKKLENQKNAVSTLNDAYDQQINGINSFGTAINQSRQLIVVSLQKIGDAIFDAVGEDVKTALTSAKNVITDLINTFTNLEPAVKKNIVIFAGLLTLSGTAVFTLGAIITILGGVSSGFIALASAVAIATGAFVGIKNLSLEDVKNAFINFKNTVIDVFDTVRASIITGIEFFNQFKGSVDGLVDNFQARFPLIFGVVETVIKASIQALKTFVQFFVDSFKFIGDLISDATKYWSEFFGIDTQVANFSSRMNQVKQELIEARVEAKRFNAELGFIGKQQSVGKLTKQLRDVRKELRNDNLNAESKQKLITKSNELRSRIQELNSERVKATKVTNDNTTSNNNNAGSFDGVVTGTTKVKDKVAELSAELARLKNQDAISSLKDQIEEAIKVGDFDKLPVLQEDLKNATRDGIAQGYEEALAQGGKASELAGQIIERETERQTKDIGKKVDEAIQGQSGGGIFDIFGDFFSPDKKNKTEQEIQQGFNQAIGASLKNSVGQVSNALLGGANSEEWKNIGTQIGGDIGQAIGTSIGGVGGGLIGKALGERTIGDAFEIGDALINGNRRDLRDSLDDGILGTVALNMVIPGLGTLNQITGGKITKAIFGNNDAGANARHSFQAWIDNLIEGANFEGKLSLFDGKDSFQLPNGRNAFDQFTDESGKITTAVGEAFEKIEPAMQSTFLSLGKAFEEVFDFDGGKAGDGIAGQLGQLLAINFQNPAGLNDLQVLLKANNIEAEQMGEALETAYLDGGLAAGEFISTSGAVKDLMADGIPSAVGASNIAFQNLAKNGLASGRQAMDAIQDVGFEGIEAGIKTLDQLKAKLIEQGEPIQQVELFMQSLAQNGITSIEGLSQATVEQTAGVVNSLQGLGFDFQQPLEGLNDMNNALGDINKTLGELPNNKTIDIEYNGVLTGEHPDRLQVDLPSGGGTVQIPAFAKGGYVDSPTLAVVGDRGAEYILPEGKLQSELSQLRGGGNSITIHVDARGDSDLESRVVHALTDIHKKAVEDSVDQVIELSERGII